MNKCEELIRNILINKFKKTDFDKFNKISSMILIFSFVLGIIILLFLTMLSDIWWSIIMGIGVSIIVIGLISSLIIVSFGTNKIKKNIFKIANESKQEIYLSISKSFEIDLFLSKNGYFGKYKNIKFFINRNSNEILINKNTKMVKDSFFNYSVNVDKKTIDFVKKRYYLSIIENLSKVISKEVDSDFKTLIKELTNESY